MTDIIEAVDVLYTNHRGETTWRRIIPIQLFYGTSNYHKTPQWLLQVTDVDKGLHRTLALSDIHCWSKKDTPMILSRDDVLLVTKTIPTPEPKQDHSNTGT